MQRREVIRSMGVLGAGVIGASVLGGAATGCTAPMASDPLAGGPFGAPTPTAGRDRWARTPTSFNRRVRTGTPATELRVLEGAVPPDVAGHAFWQSLALTDRDAGFSGDGMVWRIDFDGPVPTARSRILPTSDYFLGEAFADTHLRFESRGMMRLGPLGIQDQANTALVPLAGNRLLATVDGGRPWEIDPETLAPVSPVGRLDEYRPMLELDGFNQFVCPMFVASAHPPYDPRTGEFHGAALSIVPVAGLDFFDVMLWDGDGELKRTSIFTPDGRPLVLTQSAHQICVTRDYLVVVDTSGTIEYGKLLNPPNSWAAGQATPPRPDSWTWIIKRDDLRTKRTAVAQLARLPRGTGHFYVDYDNSGGRVVVHNSHASAMDFAEWLMPYDEHPHTGEPVRPELVNAVTPVGYDVGVVGRYEIDASTGRVVAQDMFFDDWTWGTGGISTRNPLTPDDTLGEMFHAHMGFMTDLAAQRVYRGFLDYPYRLVPTDELPWDGVPTSLVRIDHDAGKVLDGYWFPGDRHCWSPQFIPRGGTATGASDGYLAAFVYSDTVTADSTGTEIWLFDASDLSAGPVARLGHPDWEVPIVLHSAWLADLSVSRPDYVVDVRAELSSRAATWKLDPIVSSLVDGEVIPAYEAARVDP